MKKCHTIAVALVAVFVFSAVAVSVAAAELAEWLVAGKVLTGTEKLPTEGKVELIIEDTSAKIAFVCGGILDGTAGANGADTITAVLNVAKEEIKLGGTLLLCKAHTGCEENAADIEVSPENLPWTTTLTKSAGGFRDSIAGASYWSMCLVLGILVEEECTSVSSGFEVLNVATGVEAMGEVTPLASCTVGGTGAGLQEFVAGNVETAPAGLLSMN